jgi:hypothetical protein
VKGFFDGLGWSGLLSVCGDAKYRCQNEKPYCARKIAGCRVSGGHTYFFVRVTRIEACDLL